MTSLQAEFTSSGRLVLHEAEALIREESGIDVLLDGGTFAERCAVFLTDFRLVFQDSARSQTLPLCYVTRTSSDGGLFRSPKVLIDARTNNALPQYIVAECSAKAVPLPRVPTLAANYMLKFKAGNRDEFLQQLNRALEVKAWERMVTISRPKVSAFGISTVHAGGIQKTMEVEKEQAKETIGSAFSDMASLREKARDLTALAQQLKLYEEETKDEELKEIRGVMTSLGFTAGVTSESAGKNFHQQLAREISDFAYSHVEAAGGMVSLYDIYCLYNRSRPSDMISPKDLLNACKLMQRLQLPLCLHEFPSGIKTLQISTRTDSQMIDRVAALMRANEYLSVVKLGALMNVSTIVAKQYLLIGEEKGLFCRDESVEGLHFYENRFRHS